jgi:hypothetical protein
MGLWDAEPIPSRIIGLVHTALLLQADGDAPVTRQVLKRWMAPQSSSDRDDNPIFSDALSECRQLGLLLESGQDKGLTVNPAVSDIVVTRKADVAGINGLAAVTDLVRDHVRAYLAQTPTPDSNFCRMLAWMLMQSGRDFPITAKKAEDLASQQDPERKTVGYNKERYGGARFWVVFLGFGWQHSIGGAEALQPDPTAAFGDALARWMREDPPSSTFIPLSEFLRRMSSAYPWVENGAIAAEVRDGLADGPARPDRRVNDTTALALCRLEKKGIIQITKLPDASLSDAGAVWTLGWGGPRREVSHVEWIGKGNIK